MATGNRSDQFVTAIGTKYLLRLQEDTLRERPLPIRLIIEFLGTFMLVTVAAGAGVINHYAGGNPISRAAAVVAPGALVMALIYAWGPLSGVHINPAVTLAFTGRGVFPARPVTLTGRVRGLDTCGGRDRSGRTRRRNIWRLFFLECR
jgi:major intrinsic protein